MFCLKLFILIDFNSKLLGLVKMLFSLNNDYYLKMIILRGYAFYEKT